MQFIGIAWENILVGVIAALLVGLIVQAKDRAYDKYLEYQYPIAGQYITTFEDRVDGKKSTVTAPAHIEQKGKKITGRTKMPGSDREWHLQGEISDSGYVNGLYYAIDPYDRGVGNFFLYINHDRRMEGLWSGFDEVNDEISSGRYTFIPVFDAFTIEPIETEQIPSTINIAEQRLGKDYLSFEMMDKTADTDSPYFAHVASVDTNFESEQSVATKLARSVLNNGPQISEGTDRSNLTNSEVIGFCLGAVLTQSELHEYLNISRDRLPRALNHAEKVGVIRTIAISEGFENRGIGTDLAENCITECFDRGATALCVVGWEEDGKVNIGGLMEHFDFTEVERIPEYWKEDSLEHGYHCDSCGEPPCQCSAAIFTKY